MFGEVHPVNVSGLRAISPVSVPVSRSVSSRSVEPAPVQDSVALTASRTLRQSVSVLRQLGQMVTLAANLTSGILGAVSVVQQMQAAPQRILSHDQDLTLVERVAAEKGLSTFEEGTVRWLGQQGVSIQVTQNDAEVAEILGMPAYDVRTLAASGVQAAAQLGKAQAQPGYVQLDSARQELQSKVDANLARWQAQRGGMFGGMAALLGGPPPPAGHMETVKQLRDVQTQLAGLESVQVTGWKVSPGNVPLMIEGLMRSAGATTPEQRGEFMDLMRAANGDRLEQAQRRTLERQRARPGSYSQEIAAQWEKQPEMMWLNDAGPLLVPDIAYLSGADGSVVRVSAAKNEGLSLVQAMGLHSPTDERIQVDHPHLLDSSGTLPHEVGHAIDHQLQQADPAFHEQWSKRVDAALESAKGGAGTVSGYALTNRAEYIAEGVMTFIQNPDVLAEKDPALHGLVTELLDHAEQQGQRAEQAPLAYLGVAAALFLASRLLKRPSGADE